MQRYYEHAGITIFHGDCRDVLPTLTEAVDLVLTDIPYGEVNRVCNFPEFYSIDRGVADVETMPIEAVGNILTGISQTVYVWCGTAQVSPLRAGFVRAGYTTRLCIWEKTNPVPLNGQHFWLSSIEACVFARRPRAYFSEYCASPVFRGASPAAASGQRLHPTQKPEWLFRRLINASCPPGGLVLDPFMGSGTALSVAKSEGRRAIGIELNEAYCEVAAKRLHQQTLFDSSLRPQGQR